MAKMIKNFYKANEKLNEETKKIWSLAKHMTSSKFIEKIYLEEKVYLDGTTTPDKWVQFKEEIIYIYNSYNELLPILNNAQFIEINTMKEANHFINELYEMVMTLDFRLRENPENRRETLKSGLEKIKNVCTYFYCDMSMNELERKTKLAQKKNKNISIEKINNKQGQTMEVTTEYQEEFYSLLKRKEELEPNQEINYSTSIASEEEKNRWQGELEKELDMYRDNMLERRSSINSPEDWRNFEIFVKTTQNNYKWLNNHSSSESYKIYTDYLDLLEQCIEICYNKYNYSIPGSALPEIGKYIEILCIAQHISEMMNTINSLSEKGRENSSMVKIQKELEEKQKEIYEDYENAMKFMNGPTEEETPTL